MTSVYIGLGGNLGNSAQILQDAVTALDALPDTRLKAVSSLCASPAMVLPDKHRGWRTGSVKSRQPDYINAVAHIDTEIPPLCLLRLMQGIERRGGRLRTGRRWTSRTLDLDMLLYGQQQLRWPRLTVPHPGIAARAFVLLPLAEISPPNLLIPGCGSVAALLQQLPVDELKQTRKIATFTNDL